MLEKRAAAPKRDERGFLVFADFPHFSTNLTPAEVVSPSYLSGYESLHWRVRRDLLLHNKSIVTGDRGTQMKRSGPPPPIHIFKKVSCLQTIPKLTCWVCGTRPSTLERRRFAERELFIDNLLVRIHFIIVMIRWTGLAPWEFEFPFPGSLTSTFQQVLQAGAFGGTYFHPN